MNYFVNLCDPTTECRKPQMLGYVDRMRINVVFDMESQINLYPAEDEGILNHRVNIRNTDKRILSITGETFKIYGVLNLFVLVREGGEPLLTTYRVAGSKELEFFLVKSVQLTIGNRGMRILNLNIKFPYGYREEGNSGNRVMGQDWIVVGTENLDHMLASRQIIWKIFGTGDGCFVIKEKQMPMQIEIPDSPDSPDSPDTPDTPLTLN